MSTEEKRQALVRYRLRQAGVSETSLDGVRAAVSALSDAQVEQAYDSIMREAAPELRTEYAGPTESIRYTRLLEEESRAAEQAAAQAAITPAPPVAPPGSPPVGPAPTAIPDTVSLAGNQAVVGTQGNDVRAQRMEYVRQSALRNGLGEDGARVAQAIAQTEGGLTGAIGDRHISAIGSHGTFQFFGTPTRPGQLNNYARDLNMSLEQAGAYARANQEHAIDWALSNYLGNAIRNGQSRGLSGADLATFAQRTGQVSESPERAGANYQAMFSGQPAAPPGGPVATNFDHAANAGPGSAGTQGLTYAPRDPTQAPPPPLPQGGFTTREDANSFLMDTIIWGEEQMGRFDPNKPEHLASIQMIGSRVEQRIGIAMGWMQEERIYGAQAANAKLQEAQFTYQQGRDQAADRRDDRNYNYQVGRDQAADRRDDRNYNYQAGRDQIEDRRWEAQWARQSSRDQIEDQKWQDGWNRDEEWRREDMGYRAGRDQVLDARYDASYEREGQWRQEDLATRAGERQQDRDWQVEDQRQRLRGEFASFLQQGAGMMGRERADANRLRASLMPWAMPAGMQYIPGMEPGGAMEQISKFAGVPFTPRGREFTNQINPDQGVSDLQAELARLAAIHPGNFGQGG